MLDALTVVAFALCNIAVILAVMAGAVVGGRRG